MSRWRPDTVEVAKGKTVVILDDIMTEGYSLDAARLYLAPTGAKVICVSLLKTINRAYCHAPSVTLPKGPFQPNQIHPQAVPPLRYYQFQDHVIAAQAATDLTDRLKHYRSAAECPGRTGGLMGRAGASALQAKEVSPGGEWIGIRLFPSRDGLEKCPLNETRRAVSLLS